MQVQHNDSNNVAKDKSFTPTNVVVVGVGGGGKNALNRMISSGITNGIKYIAFNTDLQDLRMSKADIRIQIGDKLTKGQGAGARPEIGRKSAEESIKTIETCLANADMVFITAGMGGGTGTGAAPVIAKVAKELGKLTVAVVTKPFSFEGRQRMLYAEQGVAELRKVADAIVVIPNEKLMRLAPNMTVPEAFFKVDEVLQMGISGITDLITRPQMINLDFADVKTVMSNSGFAHLAMGFGKGGDKDTRIKDAIYNAVNSPLLETSINGATKAIVNIIGSQGMTVSEIGDAANIIYDLIDPNALIVLGMDIREGINNDEVWVTLIATGFNDQEEVKVSAKIDNRIQHNTSNIPNNGTNLGKTIQPVGTMNIGEIMAHNNSASNVGNMRAQSFVANPTNTNVSQSVASGNNINNDNVGHMQTATQTQHFGGNFAPTQHQHLMQPNIASQHPNQQQNQFGANNFSNPNQQHSQQLSGGQYPSNFQRPNPTPQQSQIGQQWAPQYQQQVQQPQLNGQYMQPQNTNAPLFGQPIPQSRVGATRVEPEKPNVPLYLQKLHK